MQIVELSFGGVSVARSVTNWDTRLAIPSSFLILYSLRFLRDIYPPYKEEGLALDTQKLHSLGSLVLDGVRTSARPHIFSCLLYDPL